MLINQEGMDKFKTLYSDFCKISILFLERESGTKADDVNVETDVDTLITLVPMIEARVCPVNASIDDDSLFLFMKHLNFKTLSFWFLRSDAVVKSVYNKLHTELERARFKALFREMLCSLQTIISLNIMYNHLKQDTSEIISDSKKIMEIVSQFRSTNGEQQAHKLLQQNYSFIVKTVNKILSDEFYLLKLVSVFNTDLVNDRDKMSEYRELFHVSTENAVHGIRCVTEISVDGIDVPNNKYSVFLRRVATNIILFQTRGIHAARFTNVVAKIYMLIYHELHNNISLSGFLDSVVESVKSSISQTDIETQGVRNLQTLIKHISDNRTRYREVLFNEYTTREACLVDILQDIATRNGVKYRGAPVVARDVIDGIKTVIADRMRNEDKIETGQSSAETSGTSSSTDAAVAKSP